MKIFVVICAALALILWRFWSLATDYERELDAHLQTQTKLTAALDEGRRWRLVAGENLLAAEAQARLAESCLAREAQSQSDAEARKAILAQAKPRPRPAEEKVVDDETRSRAVSRLNREL